MKNIYYLLREISPVESKNINTTNNKVKAVILSELLAKYKVGEIFEWIQTKNKLTLYNKNGKEVESYKFKSDGGLLPIQKLIYDDNGNEIQNYIYDFEGKLYFQFLNKYDDKGILIKQQQYYKPKFNTCSEYSFKYLDKYNEIEIIENHSSGRLVSSSTYKYDNHNLIDLIRHNYNSDDGRLVSKITYKYDDKGNTIVENSINYPIEDHPEEIETNYKYDDKGNLIEVSQCNYSAYASYEPLQFIIAYSYEFNNKGDWIKRTGYDKKDENSKLESITERLIEYYQ